MKELVEIISKSYVLYAIAGIFLLGIMSRFFLSLIYRGLQRDIGNMPVPRKKILKQIKLKYESCDKLDMQICNTEAFVRKNLCEYRVCGITLRAIEKILGQAMFFGVMTGVTAAVFAAAVELESRVIIVHIAATILGAALLFNYDKLSDISYKRQVVETGLVDFLENHLQMHLQAKERGKAAEQEGKVINFAESGRRKETDNEPSEDILQKTEKNGVPGPEDEADETRTAVEDNRIIEEVLKEFFG